MGNKAMTVDKDYYQRGYVQDMQRIFGYPHAPRKVTQKPVDGWGEEYQALIKKQWHEIAREDWWHYLNDLNFVEKLQQELFDFVFPAFLIIWREGLEQRIYQPATESELFGAIHNGRIFERMMQPGRREEVEIWIVEAFCSQVETISAADIDISYGRNEALHFFLWTFNAIGESVIVLDKILERIGTANTPGRARFWIVVIIELCFDHDTIPGMTPWTPTDGGGGISLFESGTENFDNGFLPRNLDDYCGFLTFDRIQVLLGEMSNVALNALERSLADACIQRTYTQATGVREKLTWYLGNLGMVDTYVMQNDPKFFEDAGKL